MAKFKQKQIDIIIEFNKGITNNESKVYKISSFATHVEIQKVGLPDKPKAKVVIFGLSMATMEELTMLSYKPFEISNNRISIYAGEVENSSLEGSISSSNSAESILPNAALSLVFQGEITRGYANFNSIPESAFEIHAMTGYYPSLIPDKTLSIKGSIPLSIILSTLAKIMSYDFINLGFTGALKNPILSGSLFEKIIKAAKASGAYLICDDCKLIVLPKVIPSTSTAFHLSSKNGLIGYPQFYNEGVKLTALYNSNFTFNGLLELESIVPKASGLWRIATLSHKLCANSVHDDAWFSYIYAESIM